MRQSQHDVAAIVYLITNGSLLYFILNGLKIVSLKNNRIYIYINSITHTTCMDAEIFPDEKLNSYWFKRLDSTRVPFRSFVISKEQKLAIVLCSQ